MRLEHWFYTAPLRLRSLFRRRKLEQELDEELQYHVEQNIRQHVAQGLSAEEARYAALRAMDGIEQRKEECRDMRRVNILDNLFQDVHYGLRMLAKTPGFTTAAVLILALGIGANTAIFSVVNTVLLQPLGYPHADRIVQIMQFSPGYAVGRLENVASVPQFTFLRENNNLFQAIAAYDNYEAGAVNLTGGDRPEQVKRRLVSAEYFGLFGETAQIGRVFTADEDRPGGPRVMVISDGLWRRRFAADPNINGKILLLGAEPWEIIGVLAPGLTSQLPAEIWLPLRADPAEIGQGYNLHIAALLRPDIPLETANAQLTVAHEQFRRKYPSRGPRAAPSDENFVARPLTEVVVGKVKPVLRVLLFAVGFVLLIACANVANLLLARATARKRELAIRTALGAGTRRIVSQLLTESVLLSLTGGLFGLALGYAGVRALMLINPGNIPRIGPHGSAVVLDWRVVAFTLAVSILTGLLFGLIPAFSGSRTSINTVFKQSGMQSGKGLSHKRTRAVLVVTEVALTFILLMGAALLIRSFRSLITVDAGFNAHNVLTMQMSLAKSRFTTTPEISQLIREVERRVENIQGVTAAAATFSLPFEHRFGGVVTILGSPDDRYPADACFVSRRYFDVFQVPLLRGRGFTTGDDEKSQPAVLINKMMTDGSSGTFRWTSPLLWPGGDAIGQRLSMRNEPPRQVVGIVGNVREGSLASLPQPNIYALISQLTEDRIKDLAVKAPIVWTIRTSVEPYSLQAEIERELVQASGGLPVANVRSMEQVQVASTSLQAFNMTLLVVFAGVALLLAGTGIYSVLTFMVQQRTQEIGIRMALGASSLQVRRMVVMQGLRLALIGIALGLAGSSSLTGLMKGLLFGIEGLEPMLLASAAALLTTVAMLAVYIPARRATRVDPLQALRWE